MLHLNYCINQMFHIDLIGNYKEEYLSNFSSRTYSNVKYYEIKTFLFVKKVNLHNILVLFCIINS